MTIPFVGKCFPTANEFLAYLDGIRFGAWRPRFVTMHHTGGPSLATWKTYAHGNRKVPITDAQPRGLLRQRARLEHGAHDDDDPPPAVVAVKRCSTSEPVRRFATSFGGRSSWSDPGSCTNA
ncbi:hypothetical protein [Bradyrhizobium liaoningense]